MAMQDLAQVVITAVDKTIDGTKSAASNLQGVGDAAEGLKGKLAALASILGVAAFAVLAKHAIEETARLKDLQEQYGASIDNLTLLREAHRLAGVEFGVLDGVLGKLSKNLIESRQQYSKQAEALAALGISAVDAAGNLKKPDDVLVELAGSLGKYEDGAAKVAALQALLGKEAAKYIPVLNEMATAQEYQVKLTREQVLAADDFEKGLVKLGAQKRQMVTIVANEMVPVLNDLISMFLGSQKQAGGLSTQIKQFAADGTLREWFRTVALYAAYAVDGFQYFYRFLETIGKAIVPLLLNLSTMGELVAGMMMISTGQITAGASLITGAFGKMKTAVTGFFEDVKEVWSAPVFSDRVAKALYEGGAAADKAAEGGTKLKVNFKGAADEAKGLENAFKALMNSLGGDIAKLGQEIEFMQRFGRETKGTTVALVEYETTKGKFKDLSPQKKQEALDQARIKDAYIETNKAIEEYLKKIAALNKEEADLHETRQNNALDATQDLKDEIEKLNADMVLGDERRARAQLDIEAKKWRRIIQAAEEGTQERIDAEAEYFKWLELKNRSIDFAEWRKAYDQISEGLTDALMRGFESGKSFLDNFKSVLKNAFQTMVLRPIIKPIVDFASSAITSIFFGGRGAGANGSGLGGIFGNFFGGGPFGGSDNGELLGGAAGAGDTGFSFMNNTWGGSGSMLSNGFGGAMMGYGIGQFTSSLFGNERNRGSMQMGSTIGGAIGSIWGPIGSAIGSAIGSLVGSLIKSGGGPKEGGSYNAGYSSSGAFTGAQAVTGTDNGRFFTPNARDSDVQKIVERVGLGYFDMLKALGGTAPGAVSFGLGFDTDPRGTAPNRVSSSVIVGGREVYSSRDRDVGRDPEQLQAALELEAKRAILAGLQASDLPEAVANVLGDLVAETASDEDIQKIFALATAVGQLTGALTEGLDVDKIMGDVNRSAMQAFRMQSDELKKLATNATLSTGSLEQLVGATAQYRNAAVQLIVELQNARKSVGQTIDQAIRDIRLGSLDKQGQYNFLQNEASVLAGKIGSMDSAQAIIAAVNQITQISNQAYGMLSEEERAARAGEFITGLEALRAAADKRLKDLQDETTTTANAQLKELRDAIKELTEKEKKTADQNSDTADKNLAASNVFSGAVSRGFDIRLTGGDPDLVGA